MKVLNNLFLTLYSVCFLLVLFELLISLPTIDYSLRLFLVIIFGLSVFVHYRFRKMESTSMYRKSLIVNCVFIVALLLFFASINIFDLHYIGLDTLKWLVSIFFYVYLLGLVLGLFEVVRGCFSIPKVTYKK